MNSYIANMQTLGYFEVDAAFSDVLKWDNLFSALLLVKVSTGKGTGTGRLGFTSNPLHCDGK